MPETVIVNTSYLIALNQLIVLNHLIVENVFKMSRGIGFS